MSLDSANALLENIDRRIYELEQLLTSSTGPGSNAFDQIIINRPGGGTPIIMQYAVSPPTSLVVTPGTYFDTTFADVSWTAPVDGTAAEYQIEWAKKNSPGVYELVDVKVTGGNSFRIWNLLPNQSYGVRVYGLARGTRVPSTPLPSSGFTDFTIGQDATLPNAPGGITIFSTIKSLIARITASTSIDVLNGKGTYKFELSTNSSFTAIIKTNIEGGLVSYFPDLEVNTQYWVRAFAIDNSGNQSSTSVSGTATTSYLVGSDTSMLPSGSNIVKNSLFIRQMATAGFADYWTIGSGSVSTTQGLHTVSIAGMQGGQGLSISAVTGGDYHTYQDFALTKGMWCIGCKVNRISVATASGGLGSGMNVATNSGTIVFVRDWTTTSPGTGNPQAPSQIFLGTNAIRWEWVVVNVTSASASLRLYLQQGFGGTCTGTTIFGEIQVEQGDVPTSWTGIPPSIVTADEVISGSMTTGIFTVNTVNADRLSGNTLDVAKIMTSTLSTQTITLNGGSLIAGSPPTTGVILNSQGLRAYNGGVQTLTVDVGGTVSMTGNINATSGTLKQLNVDDWINIRFGQLYTNDGIGNHITISSATSNEISLYSGQSDETARGFIQAGTSGYLSLQACTRNPGSVGQSAGFLTMQSGVGAGGGTVISMGDTGAGAPGTLFTMSRTLVTFYTNVQTNGYFFSGASYNGGYVFSDVNWGMTMVSSTGTYYHVRSVYVPQHNGSNRLWGIYDVTWSAYVAYADDYGNWLAPGSSSKSRKVDIRALPAEESSLAKIIKMKPVRYHKKLGNPEAADGRTVSEREDLGFIAEDLKKVFPEAVSEQGSGKQKVIGINQMSITTGLVHSTQELHEMVKRQASLIDSLVKKVDQLEKRAA